MGDGPAGYCGWGWWTRIERGIGGVGSARRNVGVRDGDKGGGNGGAKVGDGERRAGGGTVGPNNLTALSLILITGNGGDGGKGDAIRTTSGVWTRIGPVTRMSS